MCVAHLVAGGVTQTGEQRNELAAEGYIGLVLEDDRVELRDVCDLHLRRFRQLPASLPPVSRSYAGVRTIPWTHCS